MPGGHDHVFVYPFAIQAAWPWQSIWLGGKSMQQGQINAAMEALLALKGSKTALPGGPDNLEFALICADLICEVLDGLELCSPGNTMAGVNLFKEIFTAGSTPPVPNPFLVASKLARSKPSPKTQDYLKTRVWKGCLGSALGIVGNLTSGLTSGWNMFGVAQHGSATYSTMNHMAQLSRIGAGSSQDSLVCGWLETVQRMKSAKRGIRAGQVVGSVSLTGLPIGAITLLSSHGIKLTQNKLCLATAMHIHYYAFLNSTGNTKLAQSVTRRAAATRIFKELMSRSFLMGSFFGEYDVDAIILEPAGWQVIADKLLLV